MKIFIKESRSFCLARRQSYRVDSKNLASLMWISVFLEQVKALFYPRSFLSRNACTVINE
jgi:hypothetical protein